MSTVGSLIVKIGANIRNFTKGMQEASDTAKKTADSISGDMNTMAQNTQQATTKTGRYLTAAQQQARQMKEAFKQAERSVRQDFENLSASAAQYAGKNNDFMNSIEALGVKQKKMTDQFIANNEAMKVSFLQSTGQILALTNSSAKAMKDIKKHGSAIQVLDPIFLKISNGLENIAKKGNAAVMALRVLGPTASMKELQELTQSINTRTAAAQMLQLGAAIVTVAELVGLIKLSNHIDGRLIPAFERFKAVWEKALTPFIKAFTTAAKAVVDFGTSIGQLFAGLAQNHPVLSAMIFGFIALLPPLVALLSPLAIGIGLFKGMAVVSAAFVTAFKGVIVAFFSIIGTVMLVSAAIVGLIAAWNQMMANSPRLQAAVSNLMNVFKTAISTVLTPFKTAWDLLKTSIMNAFTSITGMEATWSNFWKLVGDAAAVVIEKFLGLKNNLIDLKDNAIVVTKQAFEDFKKMIDDNKTAIEATAYVLGAVFGPALVATGAKAVAAGASITKQFIASVVKTGAEAVVSGAKVTASFVASLAKSAVQATITAATITGQLIKSLAMYAIQGWATITNIAQQTIAWTAQKVAMVAGTAATWAMSAAQTALNFALSANPIAIVIKLVAALTAAGIYLYKNWDTVKAKMTAVWDAVKSAAKSGVNGAIAAINKLIDAWNRLEFKLPSVDVFGMKIGGFTISTPNIPKIPMLAKGGITTGPTLAMIGEGREQEAVLPLSKLEKLINGQSGGNVVNNYHVAPGAFQINAKDLKDIQDIADFFKRFPQVARSRGL